MLSLSSHSACSSFLKRVSLLSWLTCPSAYITPLQPLDIDGAVERVLTHGSRDADVILVGPASDKTSTGTHVQG